MWLDTREQPAFGFGWTRMISGHLMFSLYLKAVRLVQQKWSRCGRYNLCRPCLTRIKDHWLEMSYPIPRNNFKWIVLSEIQSTLLITVSRPQRLCCTVFAFYAGKTVYRLNYRMLCSLGEMVNSAARAEDAFEVSTREWLPATKRCKTTKKS